MGLLGTILTAVWLFLFGLTLAGWASIDNHFLGVFAIITAIVIVLELAWPRIRHI